MGRRSALHSAPNGAQWGNGLLRFHSHLKYYRPVSHCLPFRNAVIPLAACFPSTVKKDASALFKDFSIMARIVARIGRMRWEVELSKALDDFENGLTAEQKAGFRAVRDHASDSPPTIRDVMNLTAEVDYKARQRCFGPRFTRILESIQQYAAIGDVIAGGSQNVMACSVWSLVRMCFLVSLYGFSPG